MIRRPPRSTRTDTLFPYTPLFRSPDYEMAVWRQRCRARTLVIRSQDQRLPAGGDGSGTGRSPWRRGGQSAFRSEEHTSELQSLMRISYAVFCLKKKKKVHLYLNSKQHNSIHYYENLLSSLEV